jgi:hypothetical protein
MDWEGRCRKIFKVVLRNSNGGAKDNNKNLSGLPAPCSNPVPGISRKQTRLLANSGRKALKLALCLRHESEVQYV